MFLCIIVVIIIKFLSLYLECTLGNSAELGFSHLLKFFADAAPLYACLSLLPASCHSQKELDCQGLLEPWWVETGKYCGGKTSQILLNLHPFSCLLVARGLS